MKFYLIHRLMSVASGMFNQTYFECYYVAIILVLRTDTALESLLHSYDIH